MHEKERKTEVQYRLYGRNTRSVHIACTCFALVVLVVRSWSISDLSGLVRAKTLVAITT